MRATAVLMNVRIRATCSLVTGTVFSFCASFAGWFEIVSELTAETGLVMSETVAVA